MKSKQPKPDYTEEEAQRRFEATLKGALNTVPKRKPKTGAKQSRDFEGKSTPLLKK